MYEERWCNMYFDLLNILNNAWETVLKKYIYLSYALSDQMEKMMRKTCTDKTEYKLDSYLKELFKYLQNTIHRIKSTCLQKRW